jgi:hypothetical protein
MASVRRGCRELEAAILCVTPMVAELGRDLGKAFCWFMTASRLN